MGGLGYSSKDIHSLAMFVIREKAYSIVNTSKEAVRWRVVTNLFLARQPIEIPY
jgi:hypothetical protein